MPAEDSSERYDVVLTGELLAGRDIDDVVRAVAEFYGADQNRVARLFAAAPRVCKRNLTAARAERHLQALRGAGAGAELAPTSAVQASPVVASGPDADTRPAVVDTDSGAGVDDVPASDMVTTAQPASAPVANLGRPEAAELPDAVGADPALAVPGAPAVSTAPCHARRSALVGLLAGFALGALVAWWVAPLVQPGPVSVSSSDAEPTEARMAAPPAPHEMAAPDARDAPQAASAATQDASGAEGPTEPTDDAPPVSAVAGAGAGPFGLDAGLPLAALDVAAEGDAPGHRVLASVPRPEPGIEHVVAIVAADVGLCGIDARSAPLPTPADGAGLQAAFAQMQTELDRRFGAGRRTNIRLSRAGPDMNETWMQSLASGRRTLSSAWVGSAETPLAEGLDRVTLIAVAAADDRGALHVAYRFRNHADCMAELAAGSDAD